MGLAELLEGDARLCPAIECFQVRPGEAEDGGAVALGVFIPTVVSRKMIGILEGGGDTHFESFR